jgi:hypothetical protein
MAVDTLKIEERQEEVVKPEVIRNRVVIWYHDNDFDLVRALEPHLQLLALRLGVVLHFFGYPAKENKAPADLSEEDKKWSHTVRIYQEEMARYEKTQKERQQRYEWVVAALQKHCVLFLPCISNACMTQLWKDTEQDARLSAVFAQPSFGILPVVMRPTNIGEANVPDPLSAYEGHHLDSACMKIAVKIEQALRAHFQPVAKPLTTLLLPEPEHPAVAPVAPKKHWWSLF